MRMDMRIVMYVGRACRHAHRQARVDTFVSDSYLSMCIGMHIDIRVGHVYIHAYRTCVRRTCV